MRHALLPPVEAGELADGIRRLFAELDRAEDAEARVFHLVERGFGSFARAVHLSGAFDGSHAEATLGGDELPVIVPKVADRRGREIRIPIKDGP